MLNKDQCLLFLLQHKNPTGKNPSALARCMKPFQTKLVEKNLTFSSLISTSCLPCPDWASFTPPRLGLTSQPGSTLALRMDTLFAQRALSYFFSVTECFENKGALFFLVTNIVLLAWKPPPSQSSNSWIRTAFRFQAFFSSFFGRKPQESHAYLDHFQNAFIGSWICLDFKPVPIVARED